MQLSESINYILLLKNRLYFLTKLLILILKSLTKIFFLQIIKQF